MPVQCTCARCGAAAKYCSSDCARDDERKRLERPCALCGTRFVPRSDSSRPAVQRFCSRSCSDAGRMRRSVDRTCETCGAAFRAYLSTLKKTGAGRFCSMACRRETPQTLFERYVTRADDPDACWGWTGATDGKGYGRQYSYRLKHGAPAPRISWEIHVGPIPAGMYICHRCDNPICTNPRHLFLGTHADNMRDMHRKGRYPKTKPSPHARRGSASPSAKLTEDDVRAIRVRFFDGATMTAIAREYRVDRQTIASILYHKTWRHVE